MSDLIKAFILIFVAEMGDKTQLLALAFATKYSTARVLVGILIGSLLNHGLAVVLGSYISSFISTDIIQLITAVVFIIFALWTLRPEDNNIDKEKESPRFGPIITVASAFFLGELGDKTQLTAITLSAELNFPIFVLLGSVLGMIATGALGIFIGRKLGDKIPEVAIKFIAAGIFMIVGISKLINFLPAAYLNPLIITVFLAILLPIVILLVIYNIKAHKEGKETAFKSAVASLYSYYNQMNDEVAHMCLGPESCGGCEGDNCIVGHIKLVLDQCIKKGECNDLGLPLDISNKQFNKDQARESLLLTLQLLRDKPNDESYKAINEIRKSLEMIAFGKSVEQITSWEDYVEKISKTDKKMAKALF